MMNVVLVRKIYHHHNQIFYHCAGAGASSTSVGPLLNSWLAARKADLTPVDYCTKHRQFVGVST